MLLVENLQFARSPSITLSFTFAFLLIPQLPWKRLHSLLDAFGMYLVYRKQKVSLLDYVLIAYKRGVEHCFNKYHRKNGIACRVGYCGGVTQNPLYPEVKKDITGHAESIEIQFDPSKVSYAELVEFFYKMHDPTTLNYQGPDVGTQCMWDLMHECKSTC